ncbi:MAG: DUF1566 domain-containing protein [bacterium]
MKKFLLILTALFFFSCESNEMWINYFDENKDETKYSEFCSETMCSFNKIEYDGEMLEFYCGSCKLGYYCNSGGKCKKSQISWSSKAPDTVSWEDAGKYCENLEEKGHTDWRLPTISELKTLIQSCPATDIESGCKVSDSCLTDGCRKSSCSGCDKTEDGFYSKLKDSGWLWSASENPDYSNVAWAVNFDYGSIAALQKQDEYSVRCVR